MKVLHYTLGLPPYRTGGLTKYSHDLMLSQIRLGIEVCVLYPGHFNFISSSKIVFNGDYNKIRVFELVNPLPVPLLGGINRPNMFWKSEDKEIFKRFLIKLKPQVIHVHILMGIYKEFLEVANELKIKLVFTTHDYFGICPKANLIDYNDKMCSGCVPKVDCIKCNANAYSMQLIYIMQSKIYRRFKNSVFLNKAKTLKKHKIKQKEKKLNFQLSDINIDINEYLNLQKFYLKMYSMFDFFYFNSSIAQNKYSEFVDVNGEVINITHSDIKDNRKIKQYNSNEILKITYIGPLDIYKGFYFLYDTLKKLLSNGIMNWHLNVYGNDNVLPENIDISHITFNGKYAYSELEKIFYKTDVLIIPSIWKETFGYIGLEAMSFGVPVLVTENVGFKDLIIQNKTGMIIKADCEELSKKIVEIIQNRSILRNINKNIINNTFNYTMEDHTLKIIDVYKRLLKL